MSETEDFNDTTSFGNFSLTTCEACIGYTGCTCVKDPDEFHPSNVPYIKVTLATHFICIIFGTVGNLITLFTMGTADRKNKTGTNIFLISLSIADLLLVFITGPIEIMHYFAYEFVNSGSCKIAEYSRVLSGVASILNLLAVTTERFIVIVFPMKSRSLCTMTNCRRSLIVVWGLSMILAAPVLWTKEVYIMHFGNNETLVTQSYCNDYDKQLGYIFTIYQLVVCFALPALVMIVGYSIVIRVLWKSTRNMSLLTNSTSTRNRPSCRNFSNSALTSTTTTMTVNGERSPMVARNNQQSTQHQRADDVRSARKQVIKMLICVVVLFLLCWGPRFIMELLIKLQFSWLWTTEVYIARTYIFLLPMVHAILNPVVYFIMSQSFRQSVVSKFRGTCCKRPHPGSFEDLAMHQTAPRTSQYRPTMVVRHNQTKANKTQKELVVVHANGEVAADLIETVT